MKQSLSLSVAALAATVIALPLSKREVPQEHSHEKFLTLCNTFLKLDNPDGIVDCVFGLLGNAAAANGLGQIADPDCLQQASADRAFTNAKAAGDVDGMTGALVFRALERNTGKVGLASVACTAIQAVNPEIAALQQHQDPASAGAQALNKEITLELARQIASVGGDPQIALQSGTFAPGDVNDPTGAGNTCDDLGDPEGCIFTKNLLVEDATAAEITAAVAGVNTGVDAGAAAGNATADAGAAAGAGDAAAALPACPAPVVQDGAADEEVDDTADEEDVVDDGEDAAADDAATGDDTGNATGDAATGAVATGGADFGRCANAAIEFGLGFDGRTDPSFRPVDSNTFNHGSALGIGVITSFIVTRLQDQGGCGANAAAVALAQTAAQAAAGQTGQAAADAWNQALGL